MFTNNGEAFLSSTTIKIDYTIIYILFISIVISSYYPHVIYIKIIILHNIYKEEEIFPERYIHCYNLSAHVRQEGDTTIVKSR